MTHVYLSVCAAELEQRLSRQQQALEEWKANDSIQVESARADIAKLKAQTESARVASAQCKSAQTELKATKQQLAAQAKSAQLEAAQAESIRLESAQRELAALREATQQQDESRARHVAELQGTAHELHSTVEKAERTATYARQEAAALQAQVDSLSTQLQHSQVCKHSLVYLAPGCFPLWLCNLFDAVLSKCLMQCDARCVIDAMLCKHGQHSVCDSIKHSNKPTETASIVTALIFMCIMMVTLDTRHTNGTNGTAVRPNMSNWPANNALLCTLQSSAHVSGYVNKLQHSSSGLQNC